MTDDQLQAHVKSGEAYPRNVADPVHGIVRAPAAALHCADGFSVSVQASATHYCDPRNNDGPYGTFELGYPSAADELITPYAENPDDLTETVYPQVPGDVVLALVAKHGGVIKTELFAN